MRSGERTESQGVLDNKELHKCTSPQTTTVTGREMKSKYPWVFSSMCFCFQYDYILPHPQVLKGVSMCCRWNSEKIRHKHDVCAVTHVQYSTARIESSGSHKKPGR